MMFLTLFLSYNLGTILGHILKIFVNMPAEGNNVGRQEIILTKITKHRRVKAKDFKQNLKAVGLTKLIKKDTDNQILRKTTESNPSLSWRKYVYEYNKKTC